MEEEGQQVLEVRKGDGGGSVLYLFYLIFCILTAMQCAYAGRMVIVLLALKSYEIKVFLFENLDKIEIKFG